MNLKLKIFSILLNGLFIAIFVTGVIYIYLVQLKKFNHQMINTTLPSVMAEYSLKLEVAEVEKLGLAYFDSADLAQLKSAHQNLTGLEEAVQGKIKGPLAEPLKTYFVKVQKDLVLYRASLEAFLEAYSKNNRLISVNENEISNQYGVLLSLLDIMVNQLDPAEEADKGGLKNTLLGVKADIKYVVYFLSDIHHPNDLSQKVLDKLKKRLSSLRKDKLDGLDQKDENQRQFLIRFASFEVPFLKLLDQYQANANRITQLKKQNNDLSHKIYTHLDTIINHRKTEVYQTNTEFIKKERFSTILIVAFIIIVLALGGSLAFTVARDIVGSLNKLLEASRLLQKGHYGTRVKLKGSSEFFDLGKAFNQLGSYLEDRIDKQNNYNTIVSAINSTVILSAMLKKALMEITVRSNSIAGCIYLFNLKTKELQLQETYAIDKEQMQKRVALGEGIIGQAGLDKQVRIIEDIPEGALPLKLGMKESLPKSIIIFPIILRDELLGVLELASLTKYTIEQIAFLEGIVLQLAVGINNAISYNTIQRSVEELAKKTVELEEQRKNLHKVNIELETANRLKSEFLANMSHELKTPLSSIIGFTDLVLSKTPNLPEKRVKNLETVKRNARNLLQLINDILDISKIESGKISLNVEEFDLADIVSDCINIVWPLKKDKEITISKILDPNIPKIQNDKLKLRQVILNLFSNAIKFTEKGEITVTAYYVFSNSSILIEVADTGIGIPENELEHIFDKFRQVDGSSSRKYGGTGLGLTITKELCYYLGGDISAKSVYGEGSTFSVIIPANIKMHPRDLVKEKRKEKESLAPAAQTSSGLTDESMVTGIQKLLLVIDDDPEVIGQFEALLGNQGYLVKGTNTAEDGLKLLQEYHPYAVFLDILMPDRNGWEVLKAIRNNPELKDIPVIIISIIQEREMANALGANDYILKPLQKEKLLKSLKKLGKLEELDILIIDDESDSIEFLTELAKETFPNLSFAINGEEGLKRMENQLPDLILLDLMSSKFDGFKFLDMIHLDQRFNPIPVIVISARPFTAEEITKYQDNGVSILKKEGLTKKQLAKEIKLAVTRSKKSYLPQG